MESLKRRAAFVAVAGGRRVSKPGFLLQALKAEAVPGGKADRPPRFGFTVTKKIGNAVVRNRIRRRLREAVRRVESHAESATDYVLVARHAALTLQFERLVTDLRSGFEVLSRSGGTQARSANGFD
ncbi:MAG TPA: ribonuclease P protein component [Bauldia sp.]|nr:ribonuclease P protein component [Bauldia sp.]